MRPFSFGANFKGAMVAVRTPLSHWQQPSPSEQEPQSTTRRNQAKS